MSYTLDDYIREDERRNEARYRAARSDAELRRQGYSRDSLGHYTSKKPLSPSYYIDGDGYAHSDDF